MPKVLIQQENMADCGDGASDGRTRFWSFVDPFPEDFNMTPEFTALPENIRKCILSNETVTYIELTLNQTRETPQRLVFVTSDIFDDWETSITYVRAKFPDLNIPEPNDFESEHEIYFSAHGFFIDEFKFTSLFYHFTDGEDYDPEKVTKEKLQSVLKKFTQPQSGNQQYYFV